jgi:uncharacterized protein (TIGR03790 family)
MWVLPLALAFFLFLLGCGASPGDTQPVDAGEPHGDAAGDAYVDAGGADATGPSDGSSGTGDGADASPPGADAAPPSDGAVTDTSPPNGPPRRTPDEVLVVYNANSPISTAIANDYAGKRGVTNVLSIQCADSATSSDNETIALADYTSSIAAPVSQYLAAHDAIQFIVLTKGVPIRIDGADTGCCMNGGVPGQPSVDSFLAAIDYPTLSGATKVGINGSGTVGTGWLNRYWNARVPFSHSQFGGYLVTRLDGYTQSDAMNLVTEALAAEQNPGGNPPAFDVDINHSLGDKTGAPEPITAFDYDPTMGVTAEWDWSVWNADMLHARDLLAASGIPNQLYMNGTFVGNIGNLLGYFSWGSNDSTFDASAYESLTFAPGSIADTAVSTSGRTFLPTSGGQSLAADLVAHGMTCGKAYVGEPLLQGVASPSIALDRYYAGYSMAESLYAASRFVGWEDVILGDPLTAPYYGSSPLVAPTYASLFDDSSGGPQRENCAEGGMDIGSVGDGSYVVYKAVALTGARTFVVRVASAGPGGNVEVHVDSPTGATLGSCMAPVTGDWQTWTTQTCALDATTGTHDLYLVFTAGADGGSGPLFNLEWFAFRP